MKHIRSFYRNQNGATAVEFGLTAPIYFALLAAIIMIGVWFWYQQGLLNGAQAAARCAGIKRTECLTDANIKSFAVQQSMGLGISADNFTVERVSCGVLVTGTVELGGIMSSLGISAAKISGKACYPTI